jgi:hypothetical protein
MVTKCNVLLVLRYHKNLKLSLCLTNYALRHEDVWGSGYIDPLFLDLSTGQLHVPDALHSRKGPPVPIG